MAKTVQNDGRYVLPDNIADGARNDELHKYASSLRSKEVEEGEIRQKLLDANTKRCSPPLPEAEVLGIVEHVIRDYPPGNSPEYKAKRKANADRRKKAKSDSSLNDLKPYKCNDLWLGRRFARCFKNKLVYVPEVGLWGIYKEGIWQISPAAALEAGKCIDSFIDRVVDFAYSHEWINTREQKELKKATDYQSTSKRETLLREAQKQLAHSAQDFDTDLNLLNTKNGTIELDTMTFREHRASDFITKSTNCSYNKKAQAPLWIKHIARTFKGYDAVKVFTQARFGYSLLGNTNLACFYILFGQPRAGKSVTSETILNVLGDYAATAEVEFFTSKTRANEAGHELHNMRGARIIIGSEFDPAHKLNAQQLKRITGGGQVRARPMYKTSYYYLPTYYIFFDSNYFPQLYDQTVFSSGRVVAIPFMHPLPKSEQDRNLSTKLLSEESKSGILNWLLDGLQIQKELNPPIPKECMELVRQYEHENDLIGQFIEDCLEVADNPEEPCNGQLIYEDYSTWAEARGFTPLPQPGFYRELGNRPGIQRGNRRIQYNHVRISEPFYGIQRRKP